MFKRVAAIILSMIIFIMCTAISATCEEEARELTILFTSDIHSYFEPYTSKIDGVIREHGGAGRLKTLAEANANDHSIFVDAGDFAMGTLLQAGFASDAYELRLLGLAGCDATTFGNHEFDFGGTGAAEMLRSAKRSGDPLPTLIIPANLGFNDQLTPEQAELRDAMDEVGAQRYMIREINGINVGIFAMMGKEAAVYTPTSGVIWGDQAAAAKEVVKEIGDRADVIICISHSGTNGDGKTGEDFNLIKKVPEIDIVISGHSHTSYHTVITANNALLGSPGAYLAYLGRLDVVVDNAGKVTCKNYELIPCDENVASDPEMDARVTAYRNEISEKYLSDDGAGYDTVIARSDFGFMSLDDMYETRTEYPMGQLIADSYIYGAEQNGIDDVDIAMVGLGTIRESISEGDITVANAFEICSLGVGSDGTAGHPILTCYLSGEEIKLLTELEALAGGFMASIRMSYSGLSYVYYNNRAPLDRVKNLCLVRRNGTKEPIEPKRLYKVAVNMYAANLLEKLKQMSFGIMNIIPKNAQGEPVDMSNLYAYAMTDRNGNEVKEWKILRDYLMSFEKTDGIPIVPERYRTAEGRKVCFTAQGFDVVKEPGTSTIVIAAVALAIIAIIVILFLTRKQRKARRIARREAKKQKGKV